jgi:predicted O-methyltransferase YrrM
MAFAYLRYLLQAKSAHGLHSPFVFYLFNQVIHDKGHYPIYEQVEQLRSEFLKDSGEIILNDLGTGSNGLRGNKRKIKDIARHSLKSAKYGQLIFRLVNYFKPQTILELGTSLGVTTLYMGLHEFRPNVVSIEGSEEIALRAEQNFIRMKASNIQILKGNFDDVLPVQLKPLSQLDFVFFDGNHRKEPTIRYFKACLNYAHPESVFVFDDIHWSGEMEQAWEFIKQDPAVTITIDLFFIGIVFFRKEQARQNFTLKF